MKITEGSICKKYTILMKLDEDVGKYSTEKLIYLIKNVCKNYVGEFSIQVVDCGFCYTDGNFRTQHKLAVSFIGADKAQINELAGDLCAFFNQESVDIELSDYERYSVSDSL